ncbi:MAG: hypothetical protein HY088_07630 [Ignavibacteriales bacterium]|nr:hypothetical protein [Ignavibacteriales bacterium]
MNSLSYSYYFALSAGYTIGVLGWLLINRLKPEIWKADSEYQFPHSWRETLWALAAVVGTISIGQFYMAKMLIPKALIINSVITDALNQIIIFSPFLLLLVIRRQPLTTAWLPSQNLPLRLGIGMALAVGAVGLFVLVRQPSQTLGEILLNVYHPKNAHYAVQIFLEDIAVAILFVRLRSALGQKWFLIALISVAFLFSASHYPLKLREGLSFFLATRDVIIDGLLVSTVVYVLQRSRDILWFWCIHFAMDMMQFYAGNITT